MPLIRAGRVTFSRRGLSVVAVVVRELRYLDAFVRSSNRGLALAGAALLAATALIAAFASRATVGRPAGAIVAGVERVARGELVGQTPRFHAVRLVEPDEDVGPDRIHEALRYGRRLSVDSRRSLLISAKAVLKYLEENIR
ncbi:hypothetical protein WME97_35240 [Sorangium sp. So ce367]|uniref:hypothetical protein n=1 Tax=Sorangium sp. So ce367 TaxID=3133305 RepID=UPI003F5E1BFE